MNQSTVTLVAGPPGVGKTTWITNQLAHEPGPVVYFSPGNGSVPIDQTWIAAEFPAAQVLAEGQEAELLQKLATGMTTYIELGFYLNLGALDPVLGTLPCQRVAILPPALKDSEWQPWANEIVPGEAVETVTTQAQLWRSPMTGQVHDFDSLKILWFELTQGAYGQVFRAKGIFEIHDGQSVYAGFVAGLPEGDFEALNLPRWLSGRPQRFSGLEVLGQNLDQPTLVQTLQDCHLSESAILHYQQQVKESLQLEVEV